jgi:DNA polymerase-3 subunit delta'
MLFSSIIGQPKAVKLLNRAVAANRLAHGYLFTGPSGVGKTTLALALAAFLFCEDKREEAPCGRCPGCVKFASGNHPDFLRISPEGAAIKIGQVRELKKNMSFPPFTAGMRIVLIEDVQTMRREAGNSLLKILEEPPPDNLLILIASDAEPVLPTIISRCQVIPFSPLSLEQTIAVLAAMHPELGSDEVRSLAVLSGGCPGQADALGNEEVIALYHACLEAMEMDQQSRPERVELALDLAGRMAELKDGQGTLFDLLAIFIKDSMVGQLCSPAGGQESVGEEKRERWNLHQLSDKIAAVDAARKALARNCNKGLVCEVLLLELLS